MNSKLSQPPFEMFF